MKVTVLLLALASALALAADNAVIAPQSTVSHKSQATTYGAEAITIPQMLSYQGKLTDTLGQPVPNGNYPMMFLLYTVPSGGSAFWSENQSVTTKNGLFSVFLGSVTPIGSVPAAGTAYLGMAVGGGAELTQRLRIVSAAYAYKADTANYALAGGTPEYAWVRGTPDSVLFTIRQLGIARGGSGNVLYGTNRFTHVNLGVACTTGLSGQDYRYSTVSGGQLNVAAKDWSTVGGGCYNNADGNGATVCGGGYNVAAGEYAVVGGGSDDTASASWSTVGGGTRNAASGVYAMVGGGYQNAASGFVATVGGGSGNTASGQYATVAGGYLNTASADRATVGGGFGNAASGGSATVGGGSNNAASDVCATVGGGYADTSAAYYSFTTGNNSVVPSGFNGSAAFNGQRATASNQTRVGALSKASGTFTIDHPLDPHGKILNHYFIEGPEMLNIYRGSAVLDGSGRAVVTLPDYFDALNRNPMVQLTGVGTREVIYVAEDVSGNRFAIGGPARAKVYWQVTGERQDVSAEITRRLMPVEQPKTGVLAGTMLDDDFLRGAMDQLVREGKAQGIDFRTAAGRQRYEKMKQLTEQR